MVFTFQKCQNTNKSLEQILFLYFAVYQPLFTFEKALNLNVDKFQSELKMQLNSPLTLGVWLLTSTQEI